MVGTLEMVAEWLYLKYNCAESDSWKHEDEQTKNSWRKDALDILLRIGKKDILG